jgi:hypothetical protein
MKDTDVQEFALAYAKGLVSAIPVIGGLTVELLNFAIPNQRQERIETLLNILASRVFNISEQELKQKFQSTDFIDIFEDVLLQSVRATSQERLEYLASVLEKGLKEEDFDRIQSKRLLEILEKINDTEVLLLQYHALSQYEAEKLRDFMNIRGRIFDNDDLQKKAMFDHYLDNLITLGLIDPCDCEPKFSSNRQYIATDDPICATQLGYMLLQLIDLKFDADFVGTPINALDVSRGLLSTTQQLKNQIEYTKNNTVREFEKDMKQGLNTFNNELERKFKRISRGLS